MSYSFQRSVWTEHNKISKHPAENTEWILGNYGCAIIVVSNYTLASISRTLFYKLWFLFGHLQCFGWDNDNLETIY